MTQNDDYMTTYLNKLRNGTLTPADEQAREQWALRQANLRRIQQDKDVAEQARKRAQARAEHDKKLEEELVANERLSKRMDEDVRKEVERIKKSKVNDKAKIKQNKSDEHRIQVGVNKFNRDVMRAVAKNNKHGALKAEADKKKAIKHQLIQKKKIETNEKKIVKKEPVKKLTSKKFMKQKTKKVMVNPFSRASKPVFPHVKKSFPTHVKPKRLI
jgi:hypothetical protein